MKAELEPLVAATGNGRDFHANAGTRRAA